MGITNRTLLHLETKLMAVVTLHPVDADTRIGKPPLHELHCSDGYTHSCLSQTSCCLAQHIFLLT